MERKVIFLDFDGVLHPLPPEIRRKEQADDKELKEILSERYHDDIYKTVDDAVLYYIYYDFSGEACYCVRQLCQIPHTEIVLSTSWRMLYDLEIMKKLLDLHKIGCYVSDITPIQGQNRASEIQSYLDTYKDIDQYLIIDDLNLEQEFPGHMLLCTNRLHLNQYRKGYEILTDI